MVMHKPLLCSARQKNNKHIQLNSHSEQYAKISKAIKPGQVSRSKPSRSPYWTEDMNEADSPRIYQYPSVIPEFIFLMNRSRTEWK